MQEEKRIDIMVDYVKTLFFTHIPYRHMRKDNRDPKWMTRGLKPKTGFKRRLDKRIKNDESHLTTRYNELNRAVKRNTRVVKRSYESKVARDANSNPKGF